MDSIDHYKSLISDEEVIKALMKDSKAREGALNREKTRIRPNLTFFQRTVTSLVSSNKRVTSTKEPVSEEIKKPSRIRCKVKTPRTLIKEILTSNINFVKSDDKLVEPNHKESTELSPDRVSCVEKTYKEDLGKYFVPARDKKLKVNMKTQSGNLRTKTKNIVFKLNFHKDKLENATTSESVESCTEFSSNCSSGSTSDSVSSSCKSEMRIADSKEK